MSTLRSLALYTLPGIAGAVLLTVAAAYVVVAVDGGPHQVREIPDGRR